MAALSQDAQFLGSALFSMMEVGGTLTFGMRESRPTARTQAALDELVQAGCVSVKPFNDFGGVVYTLTKPFRRPTAKQVKQAGKWPITEPVSSARAALSKARGE